MILARHFDNRPDLVAGKRYDLTGQQHCNELSVLKDAKAPAAVVNDRLLGCWSWALLLRCRRWWLRSTALPR